MDFSLGVSGQKGSPKNMCCYVLTIKSEEQPGNNFWGANWRLTIVWRSNLHKPSTGQMLHTVLDAVVAETSSVSQHLVLAFVYSPIPGIWRTIDLFEMQARRCWRPCSPLHAPPQRHGQKQPVFFVLESIHKYELEQKLLLSYWNPGITELVLFWPSQKPMLVLSGVPGCTFGQFISSFFSH
jgi:hypothetical protein